MTNEQILQELDEIRKLTCTNNPWSIPPGRRITNKNVFVKQQQPPKSDYFEKKVT